MARAIDNWERRKNDWHSEHWAIRCDKVVSGSVLGWVVRKSTGVAYEFSMRPSQETVIWEKEPHRGGPQYMIDRIVDFGTIFYTEKKGGKKPPKKKSKPSDLFTAELHCPHCGVELNTHPAGSDGDYLMRCTSCGEEFYIDAQKVEYYTFSTRKAK